MSPESSQDSVEARSNVEKRLEFIGGELKRLDGQLQGLEEKQLRTQQQARGGMWAKKRLPRALELGIVEQVESRVWRQGFRLGRRGSCRRARWPIPRSWNMGGRVGLGEHGWRWEGWEGWEEAACLDDSIHKRGGAGCWVAHFCGATGVGGAWCGEYLPGGGGVTLQPWAAKRVWHVPSAVLPCPALQVGRLQQELQRVQQQAAGS